ncbi:MAG TPA: hypothetical protein VMV07_08750 [Streptosporangiaceae bacterium]|nr:hypothetical protein [Streptosporangiaceae bacterium]
MTTAQELPPRRPASPAAPSQLPAMQELAPGAADPTLAALAERIRELQALAASPSPPVRSRDPAGQGGPAAVPPDSLAHAEPAPDLREGADVSHSRANSGPARQDETASGRRAAEPESAAADYYSPIDEPAPRRSAASASQAAEYVSSQDYTSGQDHRVMDRRSGPADGYGGPQDRPARGSLAELRLRLERLPAGHPSSPYEDTGARKPAPQQLRQLELPLADEERESDPPARASLLAATAGDRNGASGTRPGSPSPSPSPNGSAHGSAHESAHGETRPAPSWKASQNGTGQPHTPPGLDHLPANGADPLDGLAGDRAKPNGAGPYDSSVTRGTGLVSPGSAGAEAPAQNGRADRTGALGGDWHDPEAGATGQNGHSGRYATLGDLAAPSARPVPPVRDTGSFDTGSFNTGSYDTGSYDTGSFSTASFDTGSFDAGSFGTATRDQADRSGLAGPGLADHGAPDHGAAGHGAPGHGAPGHGAPDHGAAGHEPVLGPGPAAPAAGRVAPADPPSTARRGLLTPEQEQIANRALGRYRAADGRNVFGGYGESGLTPAIRRVESHLPHGRLAGDTEDYTLKSPERFKEKLARMIARSSGVPAEDLAAEIYDAARYTFVFEPQEYTDGTWLVHRRLKAQGFELEARRNRWESPEYKGIRTRWRDPAHDLAFEVQFHTPTSWEVLQRTHDAYVRITDPQTPPAERAQLRARQVAASAATRPPPRCAEIGDFRADTR